jgi:hypothetical protein
VVRRGGTVVFFLADLEEVFFFSSLLQRKGSVVKAWEG